MFQPVRFDPKIDSRASQDPVADHAAAKRLLGGCKCGPGGCIWVAILGDLCQKWLSHRAYPKVMAIWQGNFANGFGVVGPFFQAKLIVQGTRIVRSPLYKSLLVSIHVCQFNSQFGHPVWSVKLSFFPAISQLNPHFHLVSTVFCRWKSWTPSVPGVLGSGSWCRWWGGGLALVQRCQAEVRAPDGQLAGGHCHCCSAQRRDWVWFWGRESHRCPFPIGWLINWGVCLPL